MNRYEALFKNLKETGTLDLPEIWLVCPKCLDAFLGEAGDRCSVCNGETKPAPLYDIVPEIERPLCDCCHFVLVSVGLEVGRFKICTTCTQVANGTWPHGVKPYISQEKAEFRIRRAKAITSLAAKRS